MSSRGKINAVIPYSTVAGQPVTVTVEYQGKQAAMTLDVVAAGFSLFADSAEGFGGSGGVQSGWDDEGPASARARSTD